MGYSSRLKILGLAFLSIIFASDCGLPASSGGSAPEVSIDLSDATSLFVVDESSTSTESLIKSATSDEEALGYLRKILSDGTIETVLVEVDEGELVPATVRPTAVFVGPDDKVYITFEGLGVSINGETCYLIRTSLDGTPECYGPDDGVIGESDVLFSIDINLARISSHFDAEGNFYFYDVSYFKKLSPGGIISEVFQFTESSIDDFEVGLDGTLYFQGSDDVGSFFRRTTSSGGVENLDTEATGDYIVNSDGDLFVEGNSSVSHGIIEDSDILFEEIQIPSEESALKFLIDSAGDGNFLFLEDASGNIYFLYSSATSGIFRIYPDDPVRVTDSDNEVTLARTSGNFIYYSGLDESNTNIFRRVDITDETFPETDLLNGEDIEVYRFQVWSDGDILFGGLRLSDNQLILGGINGETLELTVTTTTSTRIDELVLIE